ncbi:MAG: bifunctional lysylphosphatidylglycerol flippase/synthetase MprF [Nitrospirae bacterium]|nr:bifunctional lysylphosphatidylglycerol flippase/synthetase MprF [Nitrospirota bacterium]
MTKRILTSLAPLIGLLLFGVALWVLHRALAAYHYHDIVSRLADLPPGQLLLAAALTALSYLVLTGYDALAVRYVGRPLRYGRIALASFIGYAFSHNVGHSLISGGSVRFRLYSAWGLSAVEVAKVVVFCSVTFWLGFLTVAGSVFLLEPVAAPATLGLGFVSAHAVGAIGLVVVGGYLLAGAVVTGPFRIGAWEVSLPSTRLSIAQIAVSSADWLAAGSVLYALLPPSATLSFPAFLGLFLLAQIAGQASLIPGGLGVFEGVIVVLLSPSVPAASVFGSLVAYRLVYYLAPLGLAAVLLGIHEVLERREGVKRVTHWFGLWIPQLIPHILAFGTFVGGAVLLFSGATPVVGSRLAWLKEIVPLPVLELSHFLGSVTGIGLVLLARGLQQRLDAAYFLTAGLLSTGVVLSLLKGLDYEEAVVLAVMLGALVPCRRYFYRKASVIGERFTLPWIVAILLVLVGSVWLGIFSYKHIEYSNELWWHFSLAGDAPRYLRATVGAIAVALVFALARLLRPTPPEPARPSPGDLARAVPLIEGSRSTLASLALLGDKSLFFDEHGTAFLMYGVEGRSWVVLGDPIGSDDAKAALAWDFRELCDRHGGWPVFYQVDRESLPLYLDLGLTLLKLGEEGRVPLGAFTLEGGARKGLRQVHHRIVRAGCTFEVVPVEEVAALLPALHAVSDIWLAQKHTREKRFSLGSFQPNYIARFPIGLVRREGEIVAFANLWCGAGKEELAVDLMRHVPDAPSGVMEYLFVELMLWGKQQGYQWFNLGMAPLAGLESRALAPLWSRVGAFIFHHGEHFYNFQGLREYKEQFDPQWEPKYLASPGGLALPRILTDIAALVSGGMPGVIAK